MTHRIVTLTSPDGISVLQTDGFNGAYLGSTVQIDLQCVAAIGPHWLALRSGLLLSVPPDQMAALRQAWTAVVG